MNDVTFVSFAIIYNHDQKVRLFNHFGLFDCRNNGNYDNHALLW
jgi:hypothetical protein